MIGFNKQGELSSWSKQTRRVYFTVKFDNESLVNG